MGRGLIIALALSLALNVFAAGFMTARWVGHEPSDASQHAQMHGRDNPFRMMRFADELSPEARDKFRAALRQGLPQVRETHEESRRLRRELSDLLAAETWDRERIWAKMSEIQAQQALQRAAFDKTFLDALETLSEEERRLLLKAAEERRMERRKRFKRRFEERRGPPLEPAEE